MIWASNFWALAELVSINSFQAFYVEDLLAEFAIGPGVPDADVLRQLAEKSVGCQFIARMNVGINKVRTS